MSKKDERPIVVVEGAPEWMVTFGDLMSLLLTFFILLFSISEVKQKKIYELVQSFRTQWRITAPQMGYHVEQLDEVVNMLSQMSLELPDQKEGTEGKAKPVDHPFGEHADVVRIDDNLLISIAGSVLFQEHSAQLNDQAREVLARVRDKLRGPDTWIRVIGHANPTALPEGSAFRSHDELGLRRAEVVKEILVADSEEGPGIRPERVEISSRGRNDLIPEIDIHNPGERRKLDRVEIMMTPEPAFRQRRN
ncbi:MAG: OmpA family protein [Planctomycetes bacterium]|nr:OmpA family protein [Planctomycetota bacterium]